MERDCDDDWAYVAADDIAAGAQLDALFSRAVAQLIDFPSIGRPGMIAGTRELIPHENYRIVYEIMDQRVWVLALALVHAARPWPPLR